MEEQIRRIKTRIAESATRAGRDPAGIRLVAVSKTVSTDVVALARSLGVREFGENRVQELLAKATALPEDCVWHLIGPLQANKVRPAVRAAAWIHTLDSPELIERADRIAGEEGRRPVVLVEVNVSGEASKHGCHPGRVLEVARAAAVAPHLDFRGFMTMAPYGASPSQLHLVFGGLRQIRDAVQDTLGRPLPELSMGMSDDFEAAIAEGATLVRLGTALFGSRPG